MKKNFSLIGILGGTFDPIHNGHLAIVQHLLNQFPFVEIQILPCAQSPLRPPPLATNQQRIEMIDLAIKNQLKIKLNTIEIDRGGASYMIDTLTSPSMHSLNASLVLIIGADVLLSFNRWHKWEKILEKCHLMVINRPQFVLETTEKWLQDLMVKHYCDDCKVLQSKQAGCIFFTKMSEQSVSATEIRQKIKLGKLSNLELPQAVAAYILQQGLYQK